MNIMINSYCNLKCPYCFANNEINLCEEKNMTRENFIKIINFLKSSKTKNTDIRIIGGEPTIHPKFIEFIKIVVDDPFFQHIHIFSNMTFPIEIAYALIEFSNKKEISILPNFNDIDISKDKFELIVKNIKLLRKKKIITTIGINIYNPNQDLNSLYRLVKETRIKKIRWTIVSPNKKIDKDFDLKKYFNGFYDKLIEFFDFAVENRCILNLDCASIPLCAFTKEQVYELIIRNPNFLKNRECGISLDINPKLEVFRCFALSDYYKVKIENNSSMSDIYSDIKNNVKEDMVLFEECKECPRYKLNGKSCACLAYKI